MLSVFAVKIGVEGRRGTFIEHVTRFVSVETNDYVSGITIATYFRNIYQGFAVHVSKVEKIEVLEAKTFGLED